MHEEKIERRGRQKIYAATYDKMKAYRERIKTRNIEKDIIIIKEQLQRMSDTEYLETLLTTKTNCKKALRLLNQIEELNQSK